jgi:putative Holliday junction resolvase
MLRAVRVIALDVGTTGIGVAISDELRIAANPRQKISRSGNVADSQAVCSLVRAERASVVVVGLPYELSGKEGPRARRVRVFMEVLRAHLPAEVELVEQDERFSTAEATRVLLAADLSRQRRREVVDKQSAAVILQAWLDARARGK